MCFTLIEHTTNIYIIKISNDDDAFVAVADDDNDDEESMMQCYSWANHGMGHFQLLPIN